MLFNMAETENDIYASTYDALRDYRVVLNFICIVHPVRHIGQPPFIPAPSHYYYGIRCQYIVLVTIFLPYHKPTLMRLYSILTFDLPQTCRYSNIHVPHLSGRLLYISRETSVPPGNQGSNH